MTTKRKKRCGPKFTRRATDIDRAVGLAVRKLRTESGLSQDRLAQHCGVTFQQIQKYENGHNRISCGMLDRMCHALAAKPQTVFDMARLLAAELAPR